MTTMTCIPAIEFFASKVWTNSSGYAGVYSQRKKGTVLAHRFIWEECFGPIPAKMCVCHACDNPQCVNPEHLFLGTQAENLADMRAKRRQAPNPSLKLTDEQVKEIRASTLPRKKIAAKYGIHLRHVYAIRSGEKR